MMGWARMLPPEVWVHEEFLICPIYKSSQAGLLLTDSMSNSVGHCLNSLLFFFWIIIFNYLLFITIHVIQSCFQCEGTSLWVLRSQNPFGCTCL